MVIASAMYFTPERARRYHKILRLYLTTIVGFLRKHQPRCQRILNGAEDSFQRGLRSSRDGGGLLAVPIGGLGEVELGRYVCGESRD